MVIGEKTRGRKSRDTVSSKTKIDSIDRITV
jgi:hypothetical protein